MLLENKLSQYKQSNYLSLVKGESAATERSYTSVNSGPINIIQHYSMNAERNSAAANYQANPESALMHWLSDTERLSALTDQDHEGIFNNFEVPFDHFSSPLFDQGTIHKSLQFIFNFFF